jgi:hypothetical protein
MQGLQCRQYTGNASVRYKMQICCPLYIAILRSLKELKLKLLSY